MEQISARKEYLGKELMVRRQEDIPIQPTSQPHARVRSHPYDVATMYPYVTIFTAFAWRKWWREAMMVVGCLFRDGSKRPH